MAEFIEILSPSALKDLQTANLEVVKLVANIDKVGQNMAKITTPSGADNATKKLAQDYQNLQKQLANTQTQLEKNRLQEIKLAQARERAFDKYEKQSSRELEQVKKASGLYNQAQIKVRELSEMYNDLAIKKQFGQQLTVKEQAQLAKLTAELNIYQSALKRVDADIQKNQRNVGNYASGWNGLGNSINQLSREMPAFANSAQTGFMALSNNLPILFDEIEKIKTQNKELIAQGLPVKSTFSQIAGAVLSWGTALSVGVTLLTVFGPKIWDMVSGSKATKKALEEEKKVREEKASIEKQAYEQQVRYASDEQAKAKILLETAKNLTLSMSERNKAVTELQQRYPAYLGLLSKEQILAGDTADAEFRLNDALMKRAMFLAIQDKIVETTKELVDSEMEYIKTNKEAIKTDELYDLSVQNKTKSKQKYRLVNEQDLQTTKGLESVVKNSDKTLKTSTSIYNEKTLATRKQLDILYSLLNGYAKYANVVEETNTKEKKGTKAKREEIEAIKLESKEMDTLLLKLEEEIKLIKQAQLTAENNVEWKFWQNGIDTLQKYIDLIKNGSKELKDSAKKSTAEFEKLYGSRAKEQVVEMAKATRDWISSFNTDFLSSSGLGGLDMFFRKAENGRTVFQNLYDDAEKVGEGWKVTFLGMTQVAEEAFAFIDKFGQENFDNQYRRLEQQRDVAIQFAGESITAQEEINNQYDSRRRAIARRQAESEKQTATFKAIINTAQAVVSALPNIPLSIAVGLIGAAQIGLIQSQQIPQFWTGTDNAPEGMAWTQEKGREIITDKSGKIKSMGSDKGAQMTYLSKGDKVFNASETEALMFNSSLNNMLLGSGIMMPKVEVSMDAEKITNEIKSLANTIANKPSFTLVKDAKGERVYMRKQAEIKEMQNARLNIKGYDV
jgi:uncharacterized membrane-anchored protein YhcB (DUF1043 family)